jgi:D-alanyl-D-alanine carboxypeptidase/D-alanyl-D-alanine-endopeptidase (penicillin-binding protein 4)
VEKRFWQTKGIDPESLHIIDGSGLSPGNRITTAAMARVLYIASRQPWFSVYHDCLPVIHGIRMKSGHINDVCSYAGYMKAFDGTPVVFSFIVNNYNGSTAGIKQKMFRALDAIGQ